MKKPIQNNPGLLKDAPHIEIQGLRKCCMREYFGTQNSATIALPSSRYVSYMKGKRLRFHKLRQRGFKNRRIPHKQEPIKSCESELASIFDDHKGNYLNESSAADNTNASNIAKQGSIASNQESTALSSKKIRQEESCCNDYCFFEKKSGLQKLLNRVKVVKRINVMGNYTDECKKTKPYTYQLTPFQARTRNCIQRPIELIRTVEKMYGEYFDHITIPERFDPSKIKINKVKHININNDMHNELRKMKNSAATNRRAPNKTRPTTNLLNNSFLKNGSSPISSVNKIYRNIPKFVKKCRKSKGTPGISHFIKPIGKHIRPFKANNNVPTDLILSTSVKESDSKVMSFESNDMTSGSFIPEIIDNRKEYYESSAMVVSMDKSINNIIKSKSSDKLLNTKIDYLQRVQHSDTRKEHLHNESSSRQLINQISASSYNESIDKLKKTKVISRNSHQIVKSVSKNSLEYFSADNNSKLRKLKSKKPTETTLENLIDFRNNKNSTKECVNTDSPDKVQLTNPPVENKVLKNDNLKQSKHRFLSSNSIDEFIPNSSKNNTPSKSKNVITNRSPKKGKLTNASKSKPRIKKNEQKKQNINFKSNMKSGNNNITAKNTKRSSTKKSSLKESGNVLKKPTSTNKIINKVDKNKSSLKNKKKNNNCVVRNSLGGKILKTVPSQNKTNSNLDNNSPVKKKSSKTITNKSKQNSSNEIMVRKETINNSESKNNDVNTPTKKLSTEISENKK